MAAILLLPWLASAVAAAEIHVDADFTGTGDGSEAAPFPTIAEALAIAAAGDTIHVHAGTYGEQVKVEVDSLTLQGEPGAVLSAAGFAPTYDAGLLWLSDVDGLRVLDLEVEDSPTYGISGWDCTNTEIRGCTTRRTGWSGIYLSDGSNLVVDGNEIELANMATDPWQENLSINHSCHVVVSNNHVHDSGYPEVAMIDVKQGSSDVEVWGNRMENTGATSGFCHAIYIDASLLPQDDIRVFRNVVTGCGYGLVLASEAGGLLSNVLVHDNVFYGNGVRGIVISETWGNPASSHPISNVRLFNNTVWDSDLAGLYITNPELTDCIVQNNVFAGNGTVQMFDGSGSGVTFLGNCTYPRGSPYEEPGDVIADPLFVDPAAGDFHLLPSSPCVDAGSPLPAPFDIDLDFDSDPRVLNGDLSGSIEIDIGAQEFNAIHLDLALAALAGGYLLQIDVTGQPGLVTWLVVGPAGEWTFPWFGELLVDFTAGFVVPWGPTPSSTSVFTTSSLAALDGDWVQVVALDPATIIGTVSNRVVLQVP
jgi:parallel beta-helix repeat protein